MNSAVAEAGDDNLALVQDLPKIKADDKLRAFRQEVQLSWQDFNHLWFQICDSVNSPAFDIMLDIKMAGKPEYERKLWEITIDLLSSGVFGRDRPGRWKYGRYEDEQDVPL